MEDIKEKKNNNIGFACILSYILTFLIIILKNSTPVSFLFYRHILVGLSFITIVILFPHYIKNELKIFNNLSSIGLISFITLICLIFAGFLFETNIIFQLVIVSISIFLLIDTLLKVDNIKEILFFVAFNFFIIFCIYGLNYHSPDYYKLLLNGTICIDSVFHSVLSESIKTFGFPSLLYDGDYLFKYHTGTHFIFGGLAELIGIKAIEFYNLFFPTIFIPIFNYFLFKNISFHYNDKRLVYLIGLIMSFYFGIGLNISSNFHPYVSESNLVSILLFYMVGDSMLFLDRNINIVRLIMCGCFLFISYSLKISTGFVINVGICFSLLFYNWENKKAIIAWLIINMICLVLVYINFFPIDRIYFTSNLSERVKNIFYANDGILIFWSSILVFLLFSFKITTILEKYKKPIILFAIMNVAGLLISIYLSNNKSDVFYTSTITFFLSLPLLLSIIIELLNKHLFNKIPLLVIILLCISNLIYTPESLKYFSNSKNQDDKFKLKANNLKFISQISDQYDNNHIIFVDSTLRKDFFYGSQDIVDSIKINLILPALTSKRSFGLSDRKMYENDYPYYGLFYIKKINKIPFSNLGDLNRIKMNEPISGILYFYSADNKIKFKFIK